MIKNLPRILDNHWLLGQFFFENRHKSGKAFENVLTIKEISLIWGVQGTQLWSCSKKIRPWIIVFIFFVGMSFLIDCWSWSFLFSRQFFNVLVIFSYWFDFLIYGSSKFIVYLNKESLYKFYFKLKLSYKKYPKKDFIQSLKIFSSVNSK